MRVVDHDFRIACDHTSVVPTAWRVIKRTCRPSGAVTTVNFNLLTSSKEREVTDTVIVVKLSSKCPTITAGPLSYHTHVETACNLPQEAYELPQNHWSSAAETPSILSVNMR